MFQVSAAVEAQVRGKIVTVAFGWGLATFADLPWYRNLFGIIAQGAPGVRRFGLLALGFFITAQFVDIDGARKALLGAQLQRGSSVGGKNPSRGNQKG